MVARLISFSQPPGSSTPDFTQMVAYCARVSNPGNQANTETATKLVSYLIKNHHWSPFEMVSATIEIKTTRDIGRQILRHRSFSFQEFSQRYSIPEDTWEPREARLQDGPSRQSSKTPANELTAKGWEGLQAEVMYLVRAAQSWALENGIAKEQVRAILPEGLTPTTMYMAGTLRSWIHYIDLRTQEHTQKEHRQVALDCADVLKPLFPQIKEFVNVS